MKKPDYISKEDARMMRFVDNMQDLFNASFYPHSVIHYPRRVIGDFNALARWLDRQFSVEARQEQKNLSTRELSFLRSEMPGAEAFAANQILTDMRAIENSNWRAAYKPEPILAVLSSAGYELGDDLTEQAHHDTHPEKYQTEMSWLLCCYAGPVTRFLHKDDVVVADNTDFTYNKKPDRAFRTFRLTDIWRHAGKNILPQQPDPFIHCSQKQKPGEPPRLVLVTF